MNIFRTTLALIAASALLSAPTTFASTATISLTDLTDGPRRCLIRFPCRYDPDGLPFPPPSLKCGSATLLDTLILRPPPNCLIRTGYFFTRTSLVRS